MDMDNPYMQTIYRQVVTENFQSKEWKEILVNPEGVSATFHDENTLPRSGGHCFKDIPNRFIYWRVLCDKLELVEHSLDINLTENQVRIQFRDSPILDSGISIHETSESVVLLVPTAYSCHRLTFPRPSRVRYVDNNIENENVLTDASIFSNFNVPSIDDPAIFYSYNAEHSDPYIAASCLDQKHDAIFIIALKNNIMLYIRIEYISGLTTQKKICQESTAPRMLSNITKMFTAHIENPVIDSLAIHPFQHDIYIYSLDNACELKVWSIEKSVYIYIMDMKKTYLGLVDSGSRPHIIYKCADDQFLLTVYLSLSEGSKFLIFEPCIDYGRFKLQQKFYICSPMNSRLVNMALYGNEIWCIWRTGKDIACIKSVNIKNGNWKNCNLDTTNFEQYSQYLSNPKQTYLDKIFSSLTYFTEEDLKNAIAVYDTSDNFECITDYHSKISNVIDKKISQEMDKYDSTDVKSQLQIVEQCSANFYKSCLDYRRKRLTPLGIIWLGPPSFLLVLVTNSSFCFLRPTDYIENKIFSSKFHESNTEFNGLLNMLIPESKINFNMFFDINMPQNKLLELVKNVYTFENSDPKIISFLNNTHIRSLIRMMYGNHEEYKSMQSNQYSKYFRSKLGASVISHSFHQMIVTRFEMSCRLFTLMDMHSKFYGQAKEFVDAKNLVFNYWIQALFSHDIKLCKKLLVTNKCLAREPFMNYIDSLLSYTWTLTDRSSLVQFLLQERQYNFIQQMAQLLDYKQWEETLVTSYMLNNEPDKALGILKNDVHKSSEYYLRWITQFEKHNYYDHAVQLGNYVLDIFACSENQNMLSIFHSNIFLNNLKRKAYKNAYTNILCLNNQDQKLNCLHTFLLTLLENGEQVKLLSFNFSGLQSSVEDIVLKKARSLSNLGAAPFYTFLCALHNKYFKYKKLAITFYELYLRAETCIAQEENLRLSLLYLRTVNPKDAWFVAAKLPYFSKTNDIQTGVIKIKHLTKLCWLARARQSVDDSATTLDVQSAVSVLIRKHQYKEAMYLSKIWNLPLHFPLRKLVKTCLTLTNPEECDKARIWLAKNEINDNEINCKKIVWDFLETLVNRYEEKEKTLLHYHVADELLEHKASLPDWLIRKYKKINVSELLQLYLSYGELINCSGLIFELIEEEMAGDSNSVYSFGKIIPSDLIECVIANLKHHKLHKIGDDLLSSYKLLYDNIVTR
ncbi:Hypothetical protein CINCED_3A012622 [Cinara cedri]|uniref:Uncharacterized protein n=1 Tax=Cinara cedri TaxID=506608 RepID=A0A5E4MFR2_9HEMI|nr:Hypothetical protein CINCED_3A012622 [Cinara cedri]